ncbi:hypothetical protein TELCIR_04079 [Teladorsagia circumcincta]|uniref:Uncharacterized protein n=1 Tax=Teladorsagia circumcincta TaxID=45464 RepID=A0A2G9UUJ9_TELCI|nr:hypothetical protein TELCIR_04079 [Teladorsagia circumcincta]
MHCIDTGANIKKAQTMKMKSFNEKHESRDKYRFEGERKKEDDRNRNRNSLKKERFQKRTKPWLEEGDAGRAKSGFFRIFKTWRVFRSFNCSTPSPAPPCRYECYELNEIYEGKNFQTNHVFSGNFGDVVIGDFPKNHFTTTPQKQESLSSSAIQRKKSIGVELERSKNQDEYKLGYPRGQCGNVAFCALALSANTSLALSAKRWDEPRARATDGSRKPSAMSGFVSLHEKALDRLREVRSGGYDEERETPMEPIRPPQPPNSRSVVCSFRSAAGAPDLGFNKQ